MIGKLSGVIDSFGSDYILLDVGGVGYLVHCRLDLHHACHSARVKAVPRGVYPPPHVTHCAGFALCLS